MQEWRKKCRQIWRLNSFYNPDSYSKRGGGWGEWIQSVPKDPAEHAKDFNETTGLGNLPAWPLVPGTGSMAPASIVFRPVSRQYPGHPIVRTPLPPPPIYWGEPELWELLRNQRSFCAVLQFQVHCRIQYSGSANQMHSRIELQNLSTRTWV